jgi:colicin import membrane protein
MLDTAGRLTLPRAPGNIAVELVELTARPKLLFKTAHRIAEQLVASYVEAIVGRLSEAWSRPPSARLGMSATLRINTVPTGRVVGISVLHSSGDEAFDRSVQLAVERVGQFVVIAELYRRDPALFERQFRQLDIIFSPEDLRL